MWMAERDRRRTVGEGGSQVGEVTLGGDPAGVCLDGERRDLPVFGPGGYIWRPARGDEVLVIKTGENGEAPCVAGKRGQSAWNLSEGEVIIYGGGATISLRQGGLISLSGTVLVNGKPVMTEG